MRYTVLLRRNTDALGYSVIVPELPGCFSQGETLEEAIMSSKEAIELHLEGIMEDNEEVPREVEPFVIASVEVEIPTRVL